MSDKINIPIEVKSDEKGYYDRQCPNNRCEYVFKILMEDWKEKVSDEVVYCPMCGYTAPSDKWYTDEQVEQIQAIAASWAKNYISSELNKMFKNLDRSTRSNKYVKIEYKAGKSISFINNPIGQRDDWVLDISCEKCGTRYSVIGSAYFCPCCGHNAIEMVFDESLDTVEKQIGALNDIKVIYSKLYGADKSETMCRSMLEGTLGDIVSAFQKFAEARFTSLSIHKVKVNDFQRVDDGSFLFRDNLGKGYEEWLSGDEVETMKIMFQRRHILEHNNGLVDARYIDKSGDISYSIGQRLVIKMTDAVDLLNIIRKLGNGLRTL